MKRKVYGLMIFNKKIKYLKKRKTKWQDNSLRIKITNPVLKNLHLGRFYKYKIY
jgi:hypothetical protein